MKAYYVSLRNDPDSGGGVVFANTAQEARGHYGVFGLDPESWIDVQAHRKKEYDYLEGMSQREQYKAFWRDGWWFHESGYPDFDEGTDDEFYKWYDSVWGDSNQPPLKGE